VEPVRWPWVVAREFDLATRVAPTLLPDEGCKVLATPTVFSELQKIEQIVWGSLFFYSSVPLNNPQFTLLGEAVESTDLAVLVSDNSFIQVIFCDPSLVVSLKSRYTIEESFEGEFNSSWYLS
jgi:hypothetical protein